MEQTQYDAARKLKRSSSVRKAPAPPPHFRRSRSVNLHEAIRPMPPLDTDVMGKVPEPA